MAPRRRMPAMRPLRFARRWVALWLVAIACAVTVSLLPAGDVPSPPIPAFDKAMHFTSYLALSTYASMLFASQRARARWPPCCCCRSASAWKRRSIS